MECDNTVSENNRKISKRMTTQMKSHIFSPFQPISIVRFLRNFKLACETNGVHEGSPIWLFNFFMKNSSSAVLNTRSASSQKTQIWNLSAGKTITLSTYPQIFNYSLHNYAADENIAGTEDDITMFSQPPNKTSLQLAKESAAKLWFEDKYKEPDLSETFIEWLDKTIRRKHESLLDLTETS